MISKKLLLVLSGLMVLSLVMVACGPAAVEEAVVEEEEMSADEPKYGGVLRVVDDRDPPSWGPIPSSNPWGSLERTVRTNQELRGGDWTKGHAGGYGTDETNWTLLLERWSLQTGILSESWSMEADPDNDLARITYKIRQGVHWALNPDSEASRLVGGRELTAEDVAFALNALTHDEGAYLYRANPILREAKITAPDERTVIVEVGLDATEEAITRLGELAPILAPEVLKKYRMGDDAADDWTDSVGTGPFILTDFVPGSKITYIRNPNYWMKDPIGPGKGNQLPYIDGIEEVIIPDPSTRLAALRTGQIDVINRLMSVTWEDAASLEETSPWLKSISYRGFPFHWPISMRTDKPPYNDIRVRRALMMATDFNVVVDNYYNGDATIVSWPITYAKEYADAYIGLDAPDLPESVKELYVYNPDKAKQLLAEAGYPEGFKTSVVIMSRNADFMAIFKDMWAKVGVDLELDVKEMGVYRSITSKRSHEHMVFKNMRPMGGLYTAMNYWGDSHTNAAYVDDPYVDYMRSKMQTSIAKTGATAEADQIHRELMTYILDQAWVIPTPDPPRWNFWAPWIKNYAGETSVGYQNPYHEYIWLDQELKKEMGY